MLAMYLQVILRQECVDSLALNMSRNTKALKSAVNTLEQRKQELEIKELREKNAKLLEKNAKLKEHLVGKVPTVKLEVYLCNIYSSNFEYREILKKIQLLYN